MRSVSQAWGSLNASRNRERRFFFKVETVPGDTTGDVYIRSHTDISITTDGVVLSARPKSHPKIRTQTLNPDEGRATIGTLTFDAIDLSSSLTARLRLDLNTNDVGWRNKRVEYFSGFTEIAAADYELEDTQLIDRVTYSRGVYQFRCRDVQREARKNIAEPVIMRLAQPLDETSTTIEVATSSGLEAVEHGTSYSDAPSATVAYVKIDDEIIRVPEAGIGASQLTNCVRGVLGTRAAAHTTDEGAATARGKEVAEVIYLELPVPKLVYALLTGSLIGQTGTLPDHYHLGIDSGPFVRLSDFQGIGSDLYVQSDDTLGMIERYILTESEDGKRFIEKEILRKYGLFMPVHANGELGLRRGQPVLSGSAVVGEINDSMIVGEITLTYAMDKIINEIRIGWNEIGGKPSRFLNIIDQDSVDRWEDAPRLEVIARGLVGSRQTDSRVRDIFEGLRDRYSGPPIVCDVEVHSSQSLYEVGDVIRLRTASVRDFTSAAATTIDRAFEIQGVRKNLSQATVTYSLFGSSQRAGNLPPLESTTALPDAFYVSGTDIATMTGVTDTGTELQLPDGITFTGASTVAGAVFYATKDVRLPSGRTANYTGNVQLRVRGVLQIDGEFNGVGGGIAGVADTVDTSSIPDFSTPAGPVNFSTQAGTPGYFGVTQAGGGLIERTRRRSGSSSKYRVRLQSLPATITRGSVEAIPSLNLEWDGSGIEGVPADLRGTSGGPGGLRYWNNNQDAIVEINRGGTGGDGGAGLLIIARGMVFGASGRINSSGANGAAGVRNASNEKPAWSGGGAGGAPGATLILLDGASSSSPVLTDGTIIADYGATPGPGDPHNVMPDSWFFHNETRFGPPTITGAFVEEDRVSVFSSGTSGREAGIAAARFFFLLPQVTAEEDTDDVVLAGSQNISLGITEAFEARVDPAITTILATITENSTTAAYSHANIYVRGSSASAQYRGAWTFFGPAEPSLEFELPADGETYDIRAVPVLINGVEAATGVEQTQIVSAPGLGLLLNDPLLNPGFERGSDGWTLGTSAEIVEDAINARRGSRALRVNDTSGGFITETRSAERLPVDAGDRVLLQAYFKRTGGSDGNGRVRIRWYDAAGALLTTSSGGSVTDTEYTQSRLIAVAPAGAVEAEANLRMADQTTGLLWCDDVSFFIIPRDADIDALLTTNAPADAGATDGANAGTNLRNAAGTILSDIDVRNDQLVIAALGGTLTQNPDFEIFTDRSGTPGPASWITNSATEFPTYPNWPSRDIIRMSPNNTLNGAAISVNPDTEYEVVALVRAVSTTLNVDLRAEEYDTAQLPTGKRFIGSTTHAGGMQARTRLQTLVDDQSVTTTWALISASYTPTATAKWFSPALWNNGSGNAYEVEWFVVREKSTRNTGALADLDFADTDQIFADAVTDRVSSFISTGFNTAGGNTATVANITISVAAGVDILLAFGFEIVGEENGYTMILEREEAAGSPVNIWESNQQVNAGPVGNTLLDQPGAGEWTYRVQWANASGNSSTSVKNRFVVAAALKR